MIPLLMTRPRDRAEAFVAALPDGLRAQLAPHYAPLWQIAPVHGDFPDFDIALFTSRNGVLHGPAAQARPAFCVGAATTQAARQAGWQAQMLGRDADELVEALKAQGANARLVHLSGAQTRAAVVPRLKQAGLNVERYVVYEQRALPLTPEAQRLLQENASIVPLFSPLGASHFATEVCHPSALHVAVISAQTAHALGDLPVAQLAIAAQPDAANLSSAIQRLITHM